MTFKLKLSLFLLAGIVVYALWFVFWVPRTLSPGRSYWFFEPGAKPHTFKVQLPSNRGVRLEFIQLKTDIAVEVPHKDWVRDSLNGREGRELVVLSSDQDGPQQLIVRNNRDDIPVLPFNRRGFYRILVSELLPAGPDIDKAMQAIDHDVQGYRAESARNKRDAAQHYQQAADLWRELEMEEEQALSLMALSEVLPRSNQALVQKIQIFEELTTLLIGTHSESLLQTVHHNLGAAHFRNEDWLKSISHYKKSIALVGPDYGGGAVTLGELGAAHGHLGMWEAAFSYLSQARDHFANSGDFDNQIRMMIRIAWLDYMRGDYIKARDQLNKCRNMNPDIENDSSFLKSLGLVYAALGEGEHAVNKLRRALALYRGGERMRRDLVIALCQALERSGAYREALRLLDKLLPQLDPSKGFWRQATFIKAKITYVLENMQQPPAPLPPVGALAQMEQVVASFQGPMPSWAVFSDGEINGMSPHRYRRFYLDLLAAADVPDKNQILFELLEKERLSNFFPPQPNMARIQRQFPDYWNHIETLRQEIRANEFKGFAQVMRQRNGQAEQYFNKSWRALAEYRWALARISELETQSHPYPELRPLTLAQVQREHLQPGDAMLYFLMGDLFAHCLVITPEKVAWVQLSEANVVAAAAQNYVAGTLRPASRGDKPSKSLLQAGQKLSRHIWNPIRQHLGSTKRLLLVTEGALSGVPFAAIPQMDPEIPSDSDQQYLLNRFQIISTPGPSVLARWKHQRNASQNAATRGMLLFSDPVFTTDDERLSGIPPEDLPELRATLRLQRLPHTATEAAQIVKMARELADLNVHDFSGFRATKENLEALTVDTYKYLHFATHSLSFESAGGRPELSCLVLGLVDPSGNPLNGFLTSQEIRSWRLNADIVVLSMCDSALTTPVFREMNMGLADDFLVAGVRQGVIGTTWRISDLPTATLAEYIYQYLWGHDLHPAEALWMAQRKMLQNPDWSHPFFWSGLIFRGYPK